MSTRKFTRSTKTWYVQVLLVEKQRSTIGSLAVSAGRFHAGLVHGGHWHHGGPVRDGVRAGVGKDQDAVPPGAL